MTNAAAGSLMRRSPGPSTAFAGTRHEVTSRLVVRRIRRDNRTSQGELLTGWRYHALHNDTTFSTVDADLAHRAHAIIEQVFADLIDWANV